MSEKPSGLVHDEEQSTQPKVTPETKPILPDCTVSISSISCGSQTHSFSSHSAGQCNAATQTEIGIASQDARISRHAQTELASDSPMRVDHSVNKQSSLVDAPGMVNGCLGFKCNSRSYWRSQRQWSSDVNGGVRCDIGPNTVIHQPNISISSSPGQQKQRLTGALKPCQKTDSHVEEIPKLEVPSPEVGQVQTKSASGKATQSCLGCGSRDHRYKSTACPALLQTCSFCHFIRHHISCCRKKQKLSQSPRTTHTAAKEDSRDENACFVRHVSIASQHSDKQSSDRATCPLVSQVSRQLTDVSSSQSAVPKSGPHMEGSPGRAMEVAPPQPALNYRSRRHSKVTCNRRLYHSSSPLGNRKLHLCHIAHSVHQSSGTEVSQNLLLASRLAPFSGMSPQWSVELPRCTRN